MNAQFVRPIWCLMAAASLCLSLPAAAQSTLPSDPVRWSTEDSTAKARSQTLKKEADAGRRENLNQCKALPANERKACTNEAATLYRQDLARAKAALKE